MKLINTLQKTLVAFGVTASLLGTAFAQTSPPPAPAASPFSPMIYPAKGQTQAQLDTDKAECYAWAKQQTGYDPVAVALQAQSTQSAQPVTPQPAPYNQPPPSGGVVRGGAKGAAAGAAVGAIAGDAGKGAAIGAASGGAVGGVRQRRAGAAEEQAMAQQQMAQQQAATGQAAQQQAANQPKLDAFKRAFEACMEGKGYTIKW